MDLVQSGKVVEWDTHESMSKIIVREMNMLQSFKSMSDLPRALCMREKDRFFWETLLKPARTLQSIERFNKKNTTIISSFSPRSIIWKSVWIPGIGNSRSCPGEPQFWKYKQQLSSLAGRNSWWRYYYQFHPQNQHPAMNQRKQENGKGFDWAKETTIRL